MSAGATLDVTHHQPRTTRLPEAGFEHVLLIQNVTKQYQAPSGWTLTMPRFLHG
jgi:hypothetical protein